MRQDTDATKKKVDLELCCETIQSVKAAFACGADRVELCASLPDGGTTPSYGLVLNALRVRDLETMKRKNLEGSNNKTCKVHVLIRPRGGDFVYNADEVQVLKDNIRFCKQAGCDGVVLGVLLPNGCVDIDTTKQLVVC